MIGKSETIGVIAMKNGKAWGVIYEDGHSTSYGWVDPIGAKVSDPKYCEKPEDMTHRNSHYQKELSTAELVKVKITTTIEAV